MKKTFNQHKTKQFLCPQCGADLKDDGFYEDTAYPHHYDYAYDEIEQCFGQENDEEGDAISGFYCSACGEIISNYINANWRELTTSNN